jgi:hypothetical protein
MTKRRRSDGRTLASIFLDSMRPIKLITIPTSLLAAAGIYANSGTDPAGDLALLVQVLPAWAWVLMLVYIAIARFVGLFIWGGVRWTRRTTPIIGIVAWSLLFVGGAVATPMEGMSILYLIPMVIETWILARALIEDEYGI